MAKADLSAARLRELLSYEPETGLFRWRKQVSNVPAGAVAGTPKKGGYVQIGIGGKLFMGHQLAWLYVHGVWPTHDVDHRNGITSDNRIDNLRDVPRLLNMQNQRRAQKNNTTGFLGVYLDKQRNKFVARIRVPGGGNMRRIGQFDTPEAAHDAYVEAKRRLHAGCAI